MNETKSKPIVSIPFVIICLGLGLVGWLAGPSIMQWVMLQQEKSKAGGVSLPENMTDESPPLSISAGFGGGGGPVDGPGAGGGGGGGFDPEKVFGDRDADGNGFLEGDEISGRMKRSNMDADGDEKISKEEFLEGVKKRASGRGGDNKPEEAGESDDGSEESEDSTDGEASDA